MLRRMVRIKGTCMIRLACRAGAQKNPELLQGYLILPMTEIVFKKACRRSLFTVKIHKKPSGRDKEG
jgi:hypothetical protein